MKKILFKAKRVDNGEWLEGSLIDSGNHEQVFIYPHFDGASTMSCRSLVYHRMIAVDPDTICQYTELSDKNGNKIWENDIVKYHFGNDVAPIRFGKYMSCFDSTKTAHIGFYVDWDDRTKSLRKDLGYWVNMIDCNVIGNIFDNADLLKGE